MAVTTLRRPSRAGDAGEFEALGDRRLIAEIGRALDGDPELAERMTHRIHAGVPELAAGYRVTDRAVAATRADIAAFARFQRCRSHTDSEPAPPEALSLVRAFARSRIPLAVVLRTHRVGHEALADVWCEAIEQRVSDERRRYRLLRVLERAAFSFLDGLTERIVEEYEAERRRWSATGDGLRAETVRALLADEVLDIDRASRTLGYELRRWHVGMVLWCDGDEPGPIEAPDAGARLRAAADDVAEALGASALLLVPAGRCVLHAWTAPPAGVSHEPIERVTARRDGVSIAIGGPGQCMDGFRATHEQAVLCRRLMRLRAQPAGTVTAFADHSLYSVLAADLDRAFELVASELGPLAGPGPAAARMRETLLTFYAEGSSAVRAGRCLGVHANTITHRIGRCEEVLGRTVRRRRLALEVALVLREGLTGADFEQRLAAWTGTTVPT